MIPLHDFPPKAKIVDRRGVVRPLYGCSLVGINTFFEYLQQLGALLAESPLTWEQAYASDRHIHHLIDECLRLNGLEADWLTLPMVEQLLFNPGILLDVNALGESQGSKQKRVALAAQVAGLSTVTGSLEEAIRLAQNIPAGLAIDLQREAIEIRHPEARQQRIKREFQDKAKREFAGASAIKEAIEQAQAQQAQPVPPPAVPSRGKARGKARGFG